jgi:hypothetical protein
VKGRKIFSKKKGKCECFVMRQTRDKAVKGRSIRSRGSLLPPRLLQNILSVNICEQQYYTRITQHAGGFTYIFHV